MIYASLKVSEFRPSLLPHSTINDEKLFAFRASEYVRCYRTNISEDYGGIADMRILAN